MTIISLVMIIVFKKIIVVGAFRRIQIKRRSRSSPLATPSFRLITYDESGTEIGHSLKFIRRPTSTLQLSRAVKADEIQRSINQHTS